MTAAVVIEWDDDLWADAKAKLKWPGVADAMTVYANWFYAGDKFGWTDHRRQMFWEAAESLEKVVKK